MMVETLTQQRALINPNALARKSLGRLPNRVWKMEMNNPWRSSSEPASPAIGSKFSTGVVPTGGG